MQKKRSADVTPVGDKGGLRGECRHHIPKSREGFVNGVGLTQLVGRGTTLAHSLTARQVHQSELKEAKFYLLISDWFRLLEKMCHDNKELLSQI